MSEIRVIHRIGRRGPEVAIAVAQFSEQIFEFLFHLVAAVISADSDQTLRHR
jgi:hypothetical protein